MNGAAVSIVGAALTAAPVLTKAPLLPDAAAGGHACAAVATTPVARVPWAQRRLAPERVWTLTRGAGVAVGVVDTGVSAAAPALRGAVLPGQDVAGGRADDDCYGHGTFVAGLLAARPMPGRGLVGVAPGTRVLPIRVTSGQETVEAGALAKGIRAAVDGGVRVVAVALSTPNGSSALRAAVAYAAAHDVLVVAAADPAGSSSGGTAYPAALPGVVAVAPIKDGDTAAGEVPAAPPTLAAPGTNLVSVAPRGDGNVTASGDGIAVGLVAGAAALVRDYRPELSAEQVRRRLVATADHPTGRPPDRLLGYGVVDPIAAVVTELPEESGESAPRRPAPRPIRVVLPPPPDRRPVGIAMVASAAVLACAGLTGLTVAVVRRGRRRGWRPGASDPA